MPNPRSPPRVIMQHQMHFSNFPLSNVQFAVSGSMKGYTARRIIPMSDMGTNYVLERDTPPI